MSVLLTKGQKVSLSKARVVKKITVKAKWDMNKYVNESDFDLDTFAFLLKNNGKVGSDDDFIFYGNKFHSSGSIIHNGDDRTGGNNGETIDIDLSKIPSGYSRIVITISIYEQEKRLQTFKMMNNAFISIIDSENNEELIKFNLSEEDEKPYEYYSDVTSMIVGELYKDNNEWKFKAIGSWFKNTIPALCAQYGIDAE